MTDTSTREVVRLRNAGVRLGERTLWSGADLTLRSGEFMAVLGPNGVGKTTLLRALLGLLPASEGETAPARKQTDDWVERARSPIEQARLL